MLLNNSQTPIECLSSHKKIPENVTPNRKVALSFHLLLKPVGESSSGDGPTKAGKPVSPLMAERHHLLRADKVSEENSFYILTFNYK